MLAVSLVYFLVGTGIAAVTKRPRPLRPLRIIPPNRRGYFRVPRNPGDTVRTALLRSFTGPNRTMLSDARFGPGAAIGLTGNE